MPTMPNYRKRTTTNGTHKLQNVSCTTQSCRLPNTKIATQQWQNTVEKTEQYTPKNTKQTFIKYKIYSIEYGKTTQFFQKSSNLFAFISLLVSKTENFNCFLFGISTTIIYLCNENLNAIVNYVHRSSL